MKGLLTEDQLLELERHLPNPAKRSVMRKSTEPKPGSWRGSSGEQVGGRRREGSSGEQVGGRRRQGSSGDVHIYVWNRHRSNMRDEHLEDGVPAELKTLCKAYVIDAFNSAQSLESAPTGMEEIANSAAVGGELIANDD